MSEIKKIIIFILIITNSFVCAQGIEMFIPPRDIALLNNQDPDLTNCVTKKTDEEIKNPPPSLVNLSGWSDNYYVLDGTLFLKTTLTICRTSDNAFVIRGLRNCYDNFCEGSVKSNGDVFYNTGNSTLYMGNAKEDPESNAGLVGAAIAAAVVIVCCLMCITGLCICCGEGSDD